MRVRGMMNAPATRLCSLATCAGEAPETLPGRYRSPRTPPLDFHLERLPEQLLPELPLLGRKHRKDLVRRRLIQLAAQFRQCREIPAGQVFPLLRVALVPFLPNRLD